MQTEGYQRRRARVRPVLKEANKAKRLQFALEHQDWTEDDWMNVLWSDETWITGGEHGMIWITRLVNEEWAPDVLRQRELRKKGWMFWGCFSGVIKGPGIFWEKDWGTIKSETYCAHIVPIIDGWLQLNSHLPLLLQQDNAPAHTARATVQDFEERGIQPITWPPYSPDLNLIEHVWKWMKDWIAAHSTEHTTYDTLRDIVKRAWEIVLVEFLYKLLKLIRSRIQVVIDAKGGHTRY